MTVKELIAHLQTMPQDAPVVINMYSDCQDLCEDSIVADQMAKKGQIWMNGGDWKRWGESPDKLVTVCRFPGN